MILRSVESRVRLLEVDFRRLERTEQHPRKRKRLLALAHAAEGESFLNIAAMLNVHFQSVRNWVANFLNGGLSGLDERKGRGRKRLVPADKEQDICKAVELAAAQLKGGRIFGEDVKRILEEEFDIKCSMSTIYNILHRLGLVWISSRSKSPNIDIRAQEAFKKNFKKEVERVIPETVPLNQVDIWFQDEARIGQQGSITRTWAPKGTRPRVVRQRQFCNAYIFGAVCPQNGFAEAFVSPYANTQAMSINLKQISDRTQEKRHAVVVLDRAAWHTTKSLAQFENISLLPLPPASPELNPAEQIWSWLREHHLANRCYSGYDDIVDSCCEAWNRFSEKIDLVKSMCHRNWAYF